MKLNLRQTVIDFLEAHPGEPHTARQIALWMFENVRDACEEKRRNSQQDLSDDAALIQQVVAEIGANRPEIQKKEPRIRTTEGRPRRYYYAAAETEAAQPAARPMGEKERPSATALSEHALYPLLCRYLHAEFGLYPGQLHQNANAIVVNCRNSRLRSMRCKGTVHNLLICVVSCLFGATHGNGKTGCSRQTAVVGRSLRGPSGPARGGAVEA